ncbi:MAG TPA: hypothetical protein VFD65_00450, partial [Chitinophagales bacterium]|nr:hypothetical protein [Chitinophagales bacterium]
HDPNSWIYLSSKFVFGFLYFERISSMAIGAIAAYLFLFQKDRSLKVIKSYYLFFPSMLLLAYMLLKGIVLPILTNEIYSVLFAILSIHLITSTNGIFKLFNNKVLDFLGDISYGIYMYNPLSY